MCLKPSGIYNCKKNQSVSFMTPETPFNIFNELKETHEHLLQQEDYYLYLYFLHTLCWYMFIFWQQLL